MATPAASPLAASETTRSAIVAGNVTGHHLLDIEGYSLIKELLPSGKSTNSHRFRVGGRLWYISLYPNGQTLELADFISIYVRLVVEGRDKPVKAQATCSLLDQAGNPVPSYISTTGLKEFSGKASYGVARFIKREILENSEHLKDDRFTIKCDISMKKLQAEERTVASPLLVDAPPPSDLHQHLGNLLISQEGADVTFQVAGETFSAHRYILAARSPVLKAELFGSMRESDLTAIIEVSDVEPQVFRALLQFIYTDAMPEMTREEEPVVCQHLFVAADRYGMDKLKLMCEDRLSRSVDVGSVANILTLADQHSCHGLRKTCIQFLESPDALSAVLATDDFEQLCRSCPSVFREMVFKMMTKH